MKLSIVFPVKRNKEQGKSHITGVSHGLFLKPGKSRRVGFVIKVSHLVIRKDTVNSSNMWNFFSSQILSRCCSWLSIANEWNEEHADALYLLSEFHKWVSP